MASPVVLMARESRGTAARAIDFLGSGSIDAPTRIDRWNLLSGAREKSLAQNSSGITGLGISGHDLGAAEVNTSKKSGASVTRAVSGGNLPGAILSHFVRRVFMNEPWCFGALTTVFAAM